MTIFDYLDKLKYDGFWDRGKESIASRADKEGDLEKLKDAFKRDFNVEVGLIDCYIKDLENSSYVSYTIEPEERDEFEVNGYIIEDYEITIDDVNRNQVKKYLDW